MAESPRSNGVLSRFFKLRAEPSLVERVVAGALCIGTILLAWFLLTRGVAEERVLPPGIIPSPAEVLSSVHSLWFDRALTRNALLSLRRLALGFGLAVLIGVPLGIVCGTWPRLSGFVAPVSVFGRSVPISALVPLMMAWFGIEETEKVMFIFLACVMFIVFDAARSIASVPERHVQTALTLGATRTQVLFKVLVPLALPEIFGSLRLLFGLAFGYIILAEIVGAKGGLGYLIAMSERIGPKEHIYPLLIAIAVIAYATDRLLLATQHWLFPYHEA